MKKLLLAAALTAMALSGCAVKKDWGTSGGSKSDGIVKLSYTYGMFESPQTDPQQALSKAINRCSRWGYSSAEPFDFASQSCQARDMNGNCTRMMVTREFQCLGGKE